MSPTRAFGEDLLRQRERTTAAMVLGIEEKIQKLKEARSDRLRALERIRTGLAREILHGHGTPTDDRSK